MNRKLISLIAVCGLTLISGCGGNSSTTDSTTSQSTENEAASPQTTTPPIPVVEKDKILGAVCTTVPNEYETDTLAVLYICERNGSRITLQVNGPTELDAFTARFPTVKLIETQLLCGDGWKLNFQQPDFSPGDAGILYQELAKAGIPSESCF